MTVGPYRAEFGAIHHEADVGFLFTVAPASAAEAVAEALNTASEHNAIAADFHAMMAGLAAKQGGKSSDRAPLAKDRWPDLTVAEVEAMRRDANSGAGYSMAFYEVAEMLGLPAMPKSPREAWEDDIKPLLRRRIRQGDQS